MVKLDANVKKLEEAMWKKPLCIVPRRDSAAYKLLYGIGRNGKREIPKMVAARRAEKKLKNLVLD